MRLAVCSGLLGTVLLVSPALFAESKAAETALPGVSASPVVSEPPPPKVLRSAGSAPREVAIPDGKVLIEEEDLASIESALRDDAKRAASAEDAAASEDVAAQEEAAAQEDAAIEDTAVPEDVAASEDVAAAETAEGSELSPEDTDPSALQMFDVHLAPYGVWVDDAVFGRVWVPARATVGDDFAPYVTAGRWALSSAGHWVWLSDHPFGWVVFHYGRWVWSPALGWSWIPGRSYAHAWVVFRTAGYGDTYLGWAPLPPRYIWRDGRIVWLTRSPAAPYIFCPRLAAFEPQLPRYVVRQRDNAARLALQSRNIRASELASRSRKFQRDVAVQYDRATPWMPTPRRQAEPERRVFSHPLRTRLSAERTLRSSSLSTEPRPRVSGSSAEPKRHGVIPRPREKSKETQRKLKVQRAAKARDTAAAPRRASRSAVVVKRSQAKAAQSKAKAKQRNSAQPVRKPRKRS